MQNISFLMQIAIQHCDDLLFRFCTSVVEFNSKKSIQMKGIVFCLRFQTDFNK